MDRRLEYLDATHIKLQCKRAGGGKTRAQQLLVVLEICKSGEMFGLYW